MVSAKDYIWAWCKKQAGAFRKYGFRLLCFLCLFSSPKWRISSGLCLALFSVCLLCRAFMGMAFKSAFALASVPSSGSIFPEVLLSVPHFFESTLNAVRPCFSHALALVRRNSRASCRAVGSMLRGGRAWEPGESKHQGSGGAGTAGWGKTHVTFVFNAQSIYLLSAYYVPGEEGIPKCPVKGPPLHLLVDFYSSASLLMGLTFCTSCFLLA